MKLKIIHANLKWDLISSKSVFRVVAAYIKVQTSIREQTLVFLTPHLPPSPLSLSVCERERTKNRQFQMSLHLTSLFLLASSTSGFWRSVSYGSREGGGSERRGGVFHKGGHASESKKEVFVPLSHSDPWIKSRRIQVLHKERELPSKKGGKCKSCWVVRRLSS